MPMRGQHEAFSDHTYVDLDMGSRQNWSSEDQRNVVILGIAASIEAQISLMIFEFSLCLLADSTINLDSDSSIVSIRAGYEEFPLLRCGMGRNGLAIDTILLENGGIANLALQGGSGEGYGSLPTDLGLLK
nr:hypothetical protein [Tanacetum cinerariifolium]